MKKKISTLRTLRNKSTPRSKSKIISFVPKNYVNRVSPNIEKHFKDNEVEFILDNRKVKYSYQLFLNHYMQRSQSVGYSFLKSTIDLRFESFRNHLQ